VLYLYLRGMCGAGTPVADGQPYGVFAWKPSEALVEAVSDLFGGREAGS
jgi:exodeoxyribonuclease V beta subunit